uniref:Phosphatidylinositol 3-kinase n=1 Tax=viral metagenome TaxID=1070528 RepID=A0A6C0E8Z8_9ZZZZ
MDAKTQPIDIPNTSKIKKNIDTNFPFSFDKPPTPPTPIKIQKPIRKQSSTDILSSTPPNDDIITKNLQNAYQKQAKKWTNSDQILNCQRCKTEFGLLTRKHHCRACGDVFCWNCCNKNIIIPEEFISKPKESENCKIYISQFIHKTILKTDRSTLVCCDCYRKIMNIQQAPYIVKICEYLDVLTLRNVAMIPSKKWRNASIHQLAKFRNIQYVSPDDFFNEWEINSLVISQQLLTAHNTWFTAMVKTFIQKYYKFEHVDFLLNLKSIVELYTEKKGQKNTSCVNLMCSRRCNLILDLYDFIEVFKFITYIEKKEPKFWKNDLLKEIIIYYAGATSTPIINSHEIVICYIPIFCSCLITLLNTQPRKFGFSDFSFFESMLDLLCFPKKSDQSFDYDYSEIIIKVMFEMMYIDSPLKGLGGNNLLKFIKDIYIPKIGKKTLYDYVKKTCKYFDEICLTKMDPLNIKLPILYPFDINYNIVNIKSISVVKSNTSPIILDIVLSNGVNELNKKILIKNDVQLRKEQIVSCLIKILQEKLEQQSLRKRIDTFEAIPSYHILMISGDVGIIEFVEHSQTLRAINLKGYTLQNYVCDINKTEKIDIIKNRFVKSLAISSCISYILGLGDRHLDNIMMNNKGQIFHIDYGYLMENPKTHILGAPNIKMTSDMIDFIGGNQSEYYKMFKDFTCLTYDLMRLYKNIITNYYHMLADEQLIDWADFKEKLETRYLDGLNCTDIKITLVKEIETSYRYSDTITDIFHNLRQKFF